LTCFGMFWMSSDLSMAQPQSPLETSPGINAARRSSSAAASPNLVRSNSSPMAQLVAGMRLSTPPPTVQSSVSALHDVCAPFAQLASLFLLMSMACHCLVRIRWLLDRFAQDLVLIWCLNCGIASLQPLGNHVLETRARSGSSPGLLQGINSFQQHQALQAYAAQQQQQQGQGAGISQALPFDLSQFTSVAGQVRHCEGRKLHVQLQIRRDWHPELWATSCCASFLSKYPLHRSFPRITTGGNPSRTCGLGHCARRTR